MNPRFPIYIISKGRAESRLTVKTFEKIGVPYSIVVEPDEFDEYARVIDPTKVLKLDLSYKDRYDVFDDLGLSKTPGSGPARNFVWDHAETVGARYHWIMDDNINGFFRLNRNLKTPVASGTILRVMEDFVLRYSNVAMAGPNYFMFASRKTKMPAFTLNTRIYSCNMIRTSAPYRWRGRYNEDTDLSIRMLKDGLCTVLFNAFLQGKAPTLSVAGGNTDDLYKDGTKAKSAMAVAMHPDVTREIVRFGRAHHLVDYSGFRTPLARRDVADEIENEVDDYGMVLQHFDGLSWKTVPTTESLKR